MANPSALRFPLDYDANKCALIPVPVAFVPYLWGALEILQRRERWQTEDDWQRGYSAICMIGACMMAGCLDELIESNRQVYRLLDSALNGTQYTYTGSGLDNDPIVVSPPIPVVPLTLPGAEPSLKFAAEKTMRLVDNLTNATTYADAPDDRNIRQQLADLILAISEQGQLDEDMLAALTQIAGLLA